MLYNFHDGLQNKFLCFWMAWIIIPLPTVFNKPLGMFVSWVTACEFKLIIHAHPVWIEPGMKLKSSSFCLLDHEGEWIVIWNWTLPLCSRKIFRPWFIRRRVKSIGTRSYLHDHRVHSRVFQHIK